MQGLTGPVGDGSIRKWDGPDTPAKPMTERQLQREIILYARKRGWKVMHIYDSRKAIGDDWIGDNGVTGWPDLTLVRGEEIVFAELKSAKGRLTKRQREWLDILGKTPADTYIWRPADLDAAKKRLK